MPNSKKNKRLKINEIKGNSQREISGVIRKIQKHEKKYTAIFVCIFVLFFGLISYFALRVQNVELSPSEDIKEITTDISNSFATSSEVITLSVKDLLKDEIGLKNKAYMVRYTNNTKEDIRYNILFKEDKMLKESCGCNEIFPTNQIRYSLDNKEVNSLTENNIIKSGIIKSNSTEEVHVKIWLDNKFSNSNFDHTHGMFEIEKVND